MTDIALVLFGLRAILVWHFLAVLQPLDVISTNKALKHPLVVEQGDTAIGLGNAVGWAMRHWGRWWCLVKTPLLGLAPLGWVQVPVLAEPGLILLLVAANAYFLKIVRENFRNAALPIPVRFTGPPLGPSAYRPFSEEKR